MKRSNREFQPSDAFQQVRVPQPSHAQPRNSSWRNRFAASPVSHGLRHPASVSRSPPLQLTSPPSRGRACPGTAMSTPPGHAFQTCSSSFTPKQAGYAGWAYRRSHRLTTPGSAASPQRRATGTDRPCASDAWRSSPGPAPCPPTPSRASGAARACGSPRSPGRAGTPPCAGCRRTAGSYIPRRSAGTTTDPRRALPQPPIHCCARHFRQVALPAQGQFLRAIDPPHAGFPAHSANFF